MKSSRWRWHLDEIFVKINGERHYLWWTIDHEGEVLESFVTRTRDKKAALKFLKKAIGKHGQPEVIVTDRLRSYGAAMKELGAADRQETGRWLNNRVENSYLPFRRRSRQCSAFGGCERCRSSPSSTRPSQTTSIRNAASPVDVISKPSAPPLSPSGAVFARHKGQVCCPCGDLFELV
jgi:transposase-like protein